MRIYCPLRAALEDDRCRSGECEWWVSEWQGCAVWVLAVAILTRESGK